MSAVRYRFRPHLRGGDTITVDQLRDDPPPNNLTAPFSVNGDFAGAFSPGSPEGQAITQSLRNQQMIGHQPVPGMPDGIIAGGFGPATMVRQNGKNIAAAQNSNPALQTYAGVPMWGWVLGGAAILYLIAA